VKLILPCILIGVIILSVSSPSFVFAQTVKSSNSTMVLRGGILGGEDNLLNGTYSQMVFFSGNVGRVQTGQSVVIKIFEGDLLYKTDLLLVGNITSDGSFSYQTTVKGKLGLDNKIVFIYGNQTVEEILPHAHTGIPSPPLPTQPQLALPLKQFKSGISATSIQCKPSFELIIKLEDGSPACVKPLTFYSLYERGWGTNLPPPPTVEVPINKTR
jgi:hypothetical protein